MYGLAKAVIKMTFSLPPEDRNEELNTEAKNIDWTMFVPQFVLLTIVVVLGVYMPKQIVSLINNVVIGF